VCLAVLKAALKEDAETAVKVYYNGVSSTVNNNVEARNSPLKSIRDQNGSKSHITEVTIVAREAAVL
jgi:hypothetical protein